MKKLLTLLLSIAMIMVMMPSMAWAATPVAATDVASIGDAGYTSVQEAVNAAGNDSVIKLLKNTNENIVVPVGKSVTLDLNGQTLTGKSGSTPTIRNNGSMVITDNTEMQGLLTKEDSSNYIIRNEGNMTIERVRVVMTSPNGNAALITNDESCDDPQNGAALTINSGKFARCNQGLTIKNNEYGNLVINGGEFGNDTLIGTQQDGCIVTFGKADINGGTFNAIGQALSVQTYTNLKNVTNVTGGTFYGNNAIAAGAQDYEDGAKMDLNISGGAFYGTIENFCPENMDANIVISKGTFSVDVKTFKSEESNEYKKGNEYIVSATAPSHTEGMNTWTLNKDTDIYEESYVAPYIPPVTPPAPKDPVTNEGTADTNNATTNADISKDTTSKTETTTETKPDGTTSTTTTVEVSDKTAAAIVDKAVEHQSAEVVVDTTTSAAAAAPAEGDKTEVKLPADTIQTLAEKTTADVTIKSDVAEVTMDAKAVEAVAEQIAETKAETVTLVVENTKNEAEEMHFELNLVTESGKVHEFNGGNVSVTVKLNKTLQAAEKLVCVYIDDNGVMSKVEGYKNADGTFTFITGHFSTYAIMAEDEADKLIEEQTNARLKAGVENTTIKLKSALDGKAIKLSWTKSKGYKVDYYEVYKSTKKANGYGTKPYYKTKDGSKTWYKNTKELKKGVRYYYKVRGVREIGGKTVYTKYSTKAWRLVK